MAKCASKRKAIYPGTFDPVTNGHLSLIVRASSLFDELVVAVSRSGGKSPLFDLEERLKLMGKVVGKLDSPAKISVVGFDGLLADLAVELKADAIIRGLRAVSDFEYEFQMALMNRKLARDVETVFMMPALSWVYLSSSLVKEVALNGGDVGGLVPPEVKRAIKKKLPVVG
ncbi:MAG: pantetheine-phosphate adenylyltransferase [bacterium]|nr:pantetheine-phosphate adenylyltransferase [bacterium]